MRGGQGGAECGESAWWRAGATRPVFRIGRRLPDQWGLAVADDVSSEAIDWNSSFAGCMQDSHACPGWRPGKPGDYAPA